MKDNQYLPLETNHLADDKLINLIEHHGMQGYGVYVALLFELRSHRNYRCARQTLPVLARRWAVSRKLLTSIVDDFGLFGIAENEETDANTKHPLDYFFSFYLDQVMESLEKRRQQMSYVGKCRTKNHTKNDTRDQIEGSKNVKDTHFESKVTHPDTIKPALKHTVEPISEEVVVHVVQHVAQQIEYNIKEEKKRNNSRRKEKRKEGTLLLLPPNEELKRASEFEWLPLRREGERRFGTPTAATQAGRGEVGRMTVAIGANHSGSWPHRRRQIDQTAVAVRGAPA